MYLLLSVTFGARAANNFAHSMNLRMILHHGSLLDSWVPGMAILTFYTLFNFRIGWLFWLAIGSIGLRFVPLSTDYQWLNIFFSYYLQFELIRLSVVAIQRRLLGARIVSIGAFCNLGLWITFSVMSALKIPVGGNEWLYDTLFVVSFLCFPLALSLRLALEHGWINRQLMDRLKDVENLSARNLAQQREREQLLAQQNEQLERQVTERTQFFERVAFKSTWLSAITATARRLSVVVYKMLTTGAANEPAKMEQDKEQKNRHSGPDELSLFTAVPFIEKVTAWEHIVVARFSTHPSVEF